MLVNNYPNLFLDAEIYSDQEKYSRCLDAVLEHEGIAVDDVIGIGERGSGNNDLYVVHRTGIAVAYERGIFNKRIEVERVCAIASIARLRGTQEGFKGNELTITGNDSAGSEVLKIVWGLGGPDWVEPLLLKQREHLFKVISEAMDKAFEAPHRSSVRYASSKAVALTEWAADVVEAAGVEVTEQRVEEHANMIAGGVRIFGFLRSLGAPYGITDLNEFYPAGDMPAGTPIDTFDDLYDHVVARVGTAEPVDQVIDEALDGAWGEFVNGCRETYA
jgi:hypothetical protein